MMRIDYDYQILLCVVIMASLVWVLFSKRFCNQCGSWWTETTYTARLVKEVPPGGRPVEVIYHKTCKYCGHVEHRPDPSNPKKPQET